MAEHDRADLWLCTPGFEADVIAELSGATRHAPGVVRSRTRTGAPLADPVFARQVLPDAVSVSGDGPTSLLDAALRTLDDEQTGRLLSRRARLEVFAPDVLRRGSERPTAHPLQSAADELADLLEKKVAGRARKKGIEPASRADGVFQLLLTDAWRGWVSLSSAALDDPLADWPAAFPAGRAPIVGYEDAPSSAYRKLVEGLGWLGASPSADDVALDLGAAPGGWTYVLLGLGAQVVAVDRAELSDRVVGNPRLTHTKRDAFAHPLEQATWLVCDVIDEADKLLDLAERALAQPSLRVLVLTVKLKRPVARESIARARRVIDEATDFDGRIKHLVHNKNEVTLLARRRG